ncbi:MAG: hypothetical protein A2174_00090 [Candidatus Portnoybacteria bacterium RBG_13_41_18]|uniref:Peptidase C39-like domain-containing protein n=1 Tax=Candidatus Portnoybacteria bacterium RBG_13_41_18 TaxID=1801991 RepID=A0A1G2FA96_9BACT|nr:MAG: hypothetical protein A2174_00090 [Candidatus Portnoybacteria bacterium RBG_13_41_18]
MRFIKPGLLAVIVLEIASIFFMLHIYNKIVADPKNYTSVSLVSRSTKKIISNNLFDDFLPVADNIPKILPELRSALPKKFIIEDVPFTVQSPDSKWDEYGEESCEEMSEIIVDRYWRNLPLNRTIGLVERNKLIEYEIKNYGGFRDENAEQVAQRLREYFGYSDVEVIYDFTLEELKREIIKGRPIIVPAAGRRLNNPYFTQPGPLYHNLVIIGYDGDEIVTNDSGIGRGKGYRYNENVLYNAIHDFPGSKENIEEGRKAMIIVKN